jgi:hypothetical protein
MREYAQRDPRGFLSEYRDGAILDEVQRVPDLLSYIQLEVDEHPQAGRFILTGSANFKLLEGVSQSLAGRTAVLHLLPCDLEELRRFGRDPGGLYEVLWRGSYPALHDRRVDPRDWLGSYLETYIERDVRQILQIGDLGTFQTFVRLCAGRSAQLVNLSALGSDAGVVHGTARAWLSVLEASYIVLRLPAFHANVTKRLVKSPKMHLLDSGLLCYLLGIQSPEQLPQHPLRGAIFESWVVAEILKARVHRGLAARLFFYRDRKGLEIDAIVDHGTRCVAVEAKSGQTILSDAFANLEEFASVIAADRSRSGTDRVVVYGGNERQNRTVGTVLPWSEIDSFAWSR